MTDGGSSNADKKALKEKIEAMRKASKNPMASMTMRVKKFIDVSKEQVKKDDLSSTQVSMSLPRKDSVTKSISQAKQQPIEGQKASPPPSPPKDNSLMNTTGRFRNMMEKSKEQVREHEELSATQVIFLGSSRKRGRIFPKAQDEQMAKPKIKVVDVSGAFVDKKKEDEEEAVVDKPIEIKVSPGQLDQESIIKKISSLAAFRDMTTPQIARLSKCELRSWGPEEFVFKEGGANVDIMVLLLDNSVFIRKRVMKEGKERYEQIAEIPSPAIIGENSFFTGLGRSAGVYAKNHVHGLIITKDDFMRLISLDKQAVVRFFKKTTEENIERGRKTAQLYMSTLQLLWNQATSLNFTYTGRLKELDRKLDFSTDDINELQELVREVMITIRELNIMLEELYEFANLPVITVQAVDFDKVYFPPTQQSLRVFEAMVEDLKMQHDFVPLESINFKDVILNAVIRTQEKGMMVNYSAIISLSKYAYTEFARHHREFGFDIKFLTTEEASQLSDRVENSSLWDLDQPLFPGRKK